MLLGKVGNESDGFGTRYLEANAEFRHSAFLHAVTCAAISDKGGDGGGTYTRNGLNKTPPGFGGERQV